MKPTLVLFVSGDRFRWRHHRFPIAGIARCRSSQTGFRNALSDRSYAPMPVPAPTRRVSERHRRLRLPPRKDAFPVNSLFRPKLATLPFEQQNGNSWCIGEFTARRQIWSTGVHEHDP